MKSQEHTYLLSPAAQESLLEIKSYSIKHFGQSRTNQYLQEIANRLKTLSKNPDQGKPRPELKAGYYSYFFGSHTIYYRIKPKHIEVIDVLHQAMEPSKHLL